MPISTSIDLHGFAQLLPMFAKASRITIVTHSFAVRAGKRCPLKAALASIPKNCKVTIISCIPCCLMNFPHKDSEETRKQITKYYKELSPSNFNNTAEVWLSHRNHAKVVLCDNIAYVGSANFTSGSASNFEAGYITNDPDDVYRLLAFVERIKQRSIHYGKIGTSLIVQRLVQFAADVRWLVEEIIAHNCEDELVYKDVVRPRFILNQFGVPIRVMEIIRAAAQEATRLDTKAELDAIEEPIYDAGITVRLAELMDAMDSIHKQTNLPAAISADKAAEGLIEKYALHSDDPGSNPALHAEAHEIAEANENERYEAACSELREFVKSLFLVRRDIFSAVGFNK